MFEITDDRTVKVKIYGQELVLKRPTLADAQAVKGLSDTSDQQAQLSAVTGFLKNAGMPEDLIGQLTTDALNSLFEYLLHPKKS